MTQKQIVVVGDADVIMAIANLVTGELGSRVASFRVEDVAVAPQNSVVPSALRKQGNRAFPIDPLQIEAMIVESFGSARKPFTVEDVQRRLGSQSSNIPGVIREMRRDGKLLAQGVERPYRYLVASVSHDKEQKP